MSLVKVLVTIGYTQSLMKVMKTFRYFEKITTKLEFT